MSESSQPLHPLPDLHNVEALRSRRPLLIAHRGGVVAPDAPENSLAAIRLAAAANFDLVELDVRQALDDEPVLFHGVGNGNLRVDCNVDAQVQSLTSGELGNIRYRGADEPIATLDQALALCAELQLGVMLDFKDLNGDRTSPAFLSRVDALLAHYGLDGATMTISRHPLLRAALADSILRRVGDADVAAVRHGRRPDLHGTIWFDHPEQLPGDLVAPLQACGVLVLPAVNTFRYPKHSFSRLEEADIRRLQRAGVDGFQIDAIYRPLFA